MGCGSGVTCWRRLRDWQRAGGWRRLLKVIRDKRGRGCRIDWSRASVDTATIPAKRGEATGPNPVDRGRADTKQHLVVDRRDIPLAATTSAANVHDSKLFEELVDSVEPVKGPRGRPRKRLDKLHADKGYDLPALPAVLCVTEAPTSGLLTEEWRAARNSVATAG
jgi:hypothetical protein